MADGTYERRGPREAELRRFRRLIEEARRRAEAAASGARGENGGRTDARR